MDKSSSLHKILNVVLKKKYREIIDIEINHNTRRILVFGEDPIEITKYFATVFYDYEDNNSFDKKEALEDVESLAKMILTGEREKLETINFMRLKKESE